MFDAFVVSALRERGQPPKVLGLKVPTVVPERQNFPWLGAEDAAAVQKMRSPRRRLQFAAGRWLLDRAATEALGAGGYTIRVEDGRPLVFVSDGAAACSLSHSGERVLCSVARAAALGVDVEHVRERRDWRGLAKRVLHPRELRRVDALDPAQRWRAFYRTWTCKEAIAKALGIGLALPFARIALSVDSATDCAIEEAPAKYSLTDGTWRVCELDAGEGYAAALAWREW